MPPKIDLNAGPLPKNFAGFTLYRIYYGDCLVYLGRTMQPLQRRIHGHLFKKPMHREIDIHLVSKVEYATFQSQSDMNVYVIFSVPFLFKQQGLLKESFVINTCHQRRNLVNLSA